MTVPEVSLCKEQHRHLQATIIKSIMAYTGEALYDGCEGEPVVSAIASQVCASNTVLSERATLLLCTLACTDEYRCVMLTVVLTILFYLLLLLLGLYVSVPVLVVA